MSSPPKPASQPAKPTYISNGHTLDTVPVSARLNRAADSIYNFFGLYIVSLLSIDPYTASQNSRFNTRGPGRVVNGSITARGDGVGFGSARLGGGAGAGNGPRGGGGGGGGNVRRFGTVDDVRVPACGSGGCG